MSSVTYLDVAGQPVDYVNPLGAPVGLGIDTVMEEEMEDVIVEEIPSIRIGICAMNKKTKSPPMHEILSRITRFDFIEIVMFSDEVIKGQPVEEWPICDALISFYSSGFPLDKAIAYSKLRKPLVLNDLELQYTLLDRCAVYKLLEEADIETPRYAILMRDENGEPVGTDFVELEDSIQIGDVTFQKPFVEKPIDAEDHNVFIYYPSSAGGGSQRLFRKVGSRSSVYSAESCVRKFGSYLYEDFVPTDGTDVKVYTVGPEYAHAEARKSPSLDGKVERDSQGKEIRYPVILNPYEKEIAHKVCKLFKQTVCGFDLLRTHGKSYVCDVNGFSFVKTSKKYYDDCAQVLVSSILQELAPQLYKPYNLDEVSEDGPLVETFNGVTGTMMELRCVIGIIRHGDRTPKQKMKMEARDPRFIQLFKKYNYHNEKKLKIKRPKHLQEILDIARELLEEAASGSTSFENPNKLRQLKNVLEMYGHFSGINRKIQLKYLGRVRDGTPDSSGNEEKPPKQGDESESEKLLLPVKEKQRKSSKDEEALLLILKWGGELTSTGRKQAQELGRAFRCMYPGGQGEYSSLPGCGLLRLHSTYRHDLKIYASDEGRVQMTAAAFAKGFLALEGELTPILVHLVRSDKSTTEMLDTSDQATKIMARVKHRLHDILQQDKKFTDEDTRKLAPTKPSSLIQAMKKVQNPREMCAKLASLVHSLTEQLKEIIKQKKYDPRDPFLYHDDTLELMTHRWNKLDKDFRLKNGMYDISLIPDIYDGIKYDVQHNSILGLKNTHELYNIAKGLADIVIPQEYGLTAEDKVNISRKVCQRLLRKIQGDLKHADIEDTPTRLNPMYSQSVITPHRHVRTRLYFTSESHIHSVVNSLRYGGLFERDTHDSQWKRAIDFLSEIPELNYMTQIVIMLYEDPTADPMSENRFHIELHFSPGAKTLDDQSRGRSAELKASRPVPQDTTSSIPEHPPTWSGPPSDGAAARQADMYMGNPTVEGYMEKAMTNKTVPTPEGFGGSAAAAESMETGMSVNATDDQQEKHKQYSSSPLYNDEDDKTYNERPRCAIGMDDFSDPSSSPVSVDKLDGSQYLATDSEMMDEELPPERYVTRPRRSSSESNLQRTKPFRQVQSRSIEGTEEEGVPRRNSDSDAVCHHAGYREEGSKHADEAEGVSYSDQKEIMEYDTTAQTAPGDAAEDGDARSCDTRRPSLSRTRSRSRSVSDLEASASELELPTRSNSESSDSQHDIQACHSANMTESSACTTQASSHPSSAKSDSVVEKRRRRTSVPDNTGASVRIVKSSPTFKKTSQGLRRSPIRGNIGSVFLLPAVRAVTKKLSLQVHGVYRVRPLTAPKADPTRPPIADFYTEGTLAASLCPLQTLHNSIGLKTMDQFLERMTNEGAEESDVSTTDTPATTPTRKRPGKKLELKSSTHKQLLTQDSIVGLDDLDLSELTMDSSEKYSQES